MMLYLWRPSCAALEAICVRPVCLFLQACIDVCPGGGRGIFRPACRQLLVQKCAHLGMRLIVCSVQSHWRIHCGWFTGRVGQHGVWFPSRADLCGSGIADIAERGAATLPRRAVSAPAAADDRRPAAASDGNIWTTCWRLPHWPAVWHFAASTLWPSAFCKLCNWRVTLLDMTVFS